MIKIEKLENEIFGPVELTLESGGALVVRGASGSGKTRFMRGVADLDETRGEVIVDDLARSEMPAFEWRKLVRFVPADSHWWYERVGEHFEQSDGLIKDMEQLGLNPAQLNQPVSELSTGEKQRLAFLRAIADKPKVLLLDEPTSALDEHSTKGVEALIEAEMARGCSVLIASHSDVQAERFGPACLTFRAGAAEVETLLLSGELQKGGAENGGVV